MTKPTTMKWHRPLMDNGANVIEAGASCFVSLTSHMRQKYGDSGVEALRIPSEAAAAPRAAILDGTTGAELTVTTKMVLEVFRDSGRRKGSALGPDAAITYEVLALLLAWPETAAEFADILNEWCRETFATTMPRAWQGSILTLLDKGREKGFESLRPFGLVSVLQRSVARSMLRTIGDDLRPRRIEGYGYTKGEASMWP